MQEEEAGGGLGRRRPGGKKAEGEQEAKARGEGEEGQIEEERRGVLALRPPLRFVCCYCCYCCRSGSAVHTLLLCQLTLQLTELTVLQLPTYRFPRVFGDKFGDTFGDKFGDSLN